MYLKPVFISDLDMRFVGDFVSVFRLDYPMIFISGRTLIRVSGGECFHLVVCRSPSRVAEIQTQ